MKRKEETDIEMHEGINDGDVGEWFSFFTELSYAKLGPRDWFRKLPHWLPRARSLVPIASPYLRVLSTLAWILLV